MRTTMSPQLTPIRMAIIKITMAEKLWNKGNPPTLRVGIEIVAGTKENSMEFPQKTKNRIIL